MGGGSAAGMVNDVLARMRRERQNQARALDYRRFMKPAGSGPSAAKEAFAVIGTELMKFELSGQVLADLTKPAAGALGQFGRIVLL